MPYHPRYKNSQSGAALLMLIALAGMGAAVLLMQISPSANEIQREERTQRVLGEAREAVLGYAAQHGRLPRPATSALNGIEREQPCDTAQSCNGFIPWVTLGISGGDSWGKLLRYSVTPAFTEAPIRLLTPGDRTVMGRKKNGGLFYVVGQQPCELYARCAAAVIYSSGKNNLGTSTLGVHQANTVRTNLDERHNDEAANDFIQRRQSSATDVTGGEFDDLVTWVSQQHVDGLLRATQKR